MVGGNWEEVGHEEVSCVPISSQRKCSSELSPPMSHWGHPWRRAAWGQQGPGDGGGDLGGTHLLLVWLRTERGPQVCAHPQWMSRYGGQGGAVGGP